MSNYARWVLFPIDVAAIFTEERRVVEGSDAPEVQVFRVWDLTRWSKPAAPGRKPNRYEEYPIPYPRESPHPKFAVWSGDQEKDLRNWWHQRMPDAKRDPDAAEAGKRRRDEWILDDCGVAGTVTREAKESTP